MIDERNGSAPDLDPGVTAAALQRRSHEHLAARLDVHAFVDAHLDDILTLAVDTAAPAPRPLATPVWAYWGQGLADRPPVVDACLSHLRRLHRQDELHLLDDETLREHVIIPPVVQERVAHNRTHFSDILRVALLSRHGGTWVDATCYCMVHLPSFASARLDSGFLAFARNYTDTYMLSSWFMASRPGHVIPTLLRNALYVYWTHRTTLVHYFLLHFLFEALHARHAPFREAWDRTFPLDAYAAHRLQGCWLSPGDEGQWREVLDASPVHKLTYKLDAHAPRHGSFHDHLISTAYPSAR